MFYGLKTSTQRLIFGLQTRFIRHTDPIRVDPTSSLTLFTQLQHKDVQLALIAIKSFLGKVPAAGIHVLNDGSLNETDIQTLRKHFPDLVIHDIASVAIDTQKCPTGGTWERLLKIAELVNSHYVIQLDSDTLTLGDLPEVIDYIANNISFAIGTWDRQILESALEYQKRADLALTKVKGEPHVQVLAEANLHRLQSSHKLNYVRGCSGFSGFAKGSFSREFVEDISGQMLGILGDRWREWGSEQVMSNIVVANSPRATVLPHPKYSDCLKMQMGQTVFIHFIGTCRFLRGIYAKLVYDVGKTLGWVS